MWQNWRFLTQIFIEQVFIHAGETVVQAIKNQQDNRSNALTQWTINFLESENADEYVQQDGGWVSMLLIGWYHRFIYLYNKCTGMQLSMAFYV